MMERIETLWVDQFYQSRDQLDELENKNLEPNFNAFCMVLRVLERVYTHTIEHVSKTLNG